MSEGSSHLGVVRNEQDLQRELQGMRDERRRSEGADAVFVDPKRLVLVSPNGHFWQFTVNNSGILTTVDLGTDPL